MPANHGQTLLSSLLILAALRSVAPAADWPQWGGDNHRNMVSAEKGLPTEFVPGNRSAGTIDPATTRNVRWVARLGSHTYGTPVVAGGRVFVGTNDFGLSDPRLKTARGGLLKCLDAATGKTLWQLIIPRKEVDPKEFAFDHMHLGLCSSATVDGERLYVVSNRCEVLCLDVDGMADGNDGPFVDEGRYIVAKGEPRKGDGADLPERPEGCFAQISPVPFSPHDGDIVWRFDMWEDPRVATRPTDAANCCVLADGDFLYVCTSNGVDQWPSDTSPLVVPAPLAPSLIVLEKHTGRLVAMDEEKIGTRLLHGQWSSPSLGVVGGRKLVFFGAGDGRCYAFEAVSEVRQEPYALEKVWSCDCIPLEYRVYEDGKLLDYRCGDRRNPMSRNRNDGRFVGLSEIVATPVFHRDRVYVAIGRDPHHGRGRGMLTCIDATLSGDITGPGKIWTYDEIERSVSTCAIADGLLWVADVAGTLHCLDADTGRPQWVHETGEETWASPLVADGKVYLGTQRHFRVFAAGREFRLLATIRLGMPMWCTAVAANRTLYVASQRYLWAVGKP